MDKWRGVIKDKIRNGKPYSFKNKPGVKLDQNEVPFDIPAEIKQEIFEKAAKQKWNRYSSMFGDLLREALSKNLNVPVEQIVVGVGSDEMILIAMSMALGKNSTVMFPIPTFPMYGYNLRFLEAKAINPQMGPGLIFPVDEMVNIVQNEKVDMVILTSPNNPTANSMEIADIERIAKVTDGIVIIDEAYFEFSNKTALNLLKYYKNCIILRTFSKAFGIAGLRVGYAIADPEVAEYLHRVRLPFSLNIFSETAAVAMLGHQDLLQKNVETVKKYKAAMIQELETIKSIKVYPSDTNFFIVEGEMNGSEIAQRLEEASISVRDMSKQPLLENCIRVSVGLQEENEKFVDALKKICNGVN